MPADHDTASEPNGAATLIDDDEALDLLGEEEDLAEELLDEEPLVEPLEIDEPLLEDPAMAEIAGEPESDLDELLLDDDLLRAVPATDTAPDAERRIERLETAARELARAELVREQRRVKRKVSAATTGAGAVGFIPILLQLIGAYDLSPELAATASAVAASVGAFAAGWVTPERRPPLPAPVVRDLLD